MISGISVLQRCFGTMIILGANAKTVLFQANTYAKACLDARVGTGHSCGAIFYRYFSLLVGTLFLFFGNGLHSLLLPLRGTAEGYSTTTLGLLGTSWSAGFVAGCFLAPLVVRRIGHVRAFSGFLSLTAIIALLTGILVDPIAWIALRALTGFASAGTSMIIESWLNERVDNRNRGVISRPIS